MCAVAGHALPVLAVCLLLVCCVSLCVLCVSVLCVSLFVCCACVLSVCCVCGCLLGSVCRACLPCRAVAVVASVFTILMFCSKKIFLTGFYNLINLLKKD